MTKGEPSLSFSMALTTAGKQYPPQDYADKEL